MKTRPILFTAPMVRAILRDVNPKSQTRRLIKKAFNHTWAGAVLPARESGWIAWWPGTERGLAEFTKTKYKDGFPCPYGQPGDRLWVKEPWNYVRDRTPEEQAKTEAILRRFEDGEVKSIFKEAKLFPVATGEKRPIYAADFGDWAYDPDSDMHWRNTMFMPRAYSRITLELTGVRVERVQDISVDDAIAEGAMLDTSGRHKLYGYKTPVNDFWRMSPVDAYMHAWDSIHGKKHPWASSPWVWVLEFKRVLSGDTEVSGERAAAANRR